MHEGNSSNNLSSDIDAIENEVLFMACDVNENIRGNEENIFVPNKMLLKRDLPKMQKIYDIIQLIRKHFTVNMDDFDLHKEIVSRLNYDLMDIYRYLNNREKYKCILYK